MADYPPKKAAAYTFEFPVYDTSGKYVTGVTFTSSELSKDGAGVAPLDSGPVEIGSTGVYTQALTATEMTCDRYAIKYVVSGRPDLFVRGETVVNQLVDIRGDTAAILLDTGTDGVVIANGAITAAKFGAGAVDAAALATDAVNEIVAAVFARTYEATKMSGLTFEEITAMMACALLSRASGMDTATGIFRNRGNTADAITATIDAFGNRTAVTLTLTAVR